MPRYLCALAVIALLNLAACSEGFRLKRKTQGISAGTVPFEASEGTDSDSTKRPWDEEVDDDQAALIEEEAKAEADDDHEQEEEDDNDEQVEESEDDPAALIEEEGAGQDADDGDFDDVVSRRKIIFTVESADEMLSSVKIAAKAAKLTEELLNKVMANPRSATKVTDSTGKVYTYREFFYSSHSSPSSASFPLTFSFDSSNNMTVARHGTIVHSGRKAGYQFQEGQLHKAFVVELLDRLNDQAVFVKYGSGQLCSTGPFTAEKLTCSSIPKQTFEAAVAHFSRFVPPSDRGFGLEFEFVGRGNGVVNGNYYDYDKWDKWYDNYGRRRGSGGGGDEGLEDCSLNVTGALEHSHWKALARWSWEQDSSVRPLTRDQARKLGLGNGTETSGRPFELKSPGPPDVLSGKDGFQEAVKMITILKHMGVQAGPSAGLHVHINVLKKNVPGKTLTPDGVASVWAAYMKYQLAINEMLSPSRVGNRYAKDHFLQSRKIDGAFHTIHACLQKQWNMFKRCDIGAAMRYSDRRVQLNLRSLAVFGTLEFRAHSATYDMERIGRWVQFLVAFVEHFGNGNGKSNTFFSGSEHEGYAKLVEAQRMASIDDLFDELKGSIDVGTAQYYKGRSWEVGDRSCKLAGDGLSQFDPAAAEARRRRR